MKKLLGGIILLSIFSFVTLPSQAKAQNSTDATMSGQIDSFTLFWPLTAGKTRVDGISYKLKKLKESLREILLFSSGAKADYKVFLATKRLVEAEELWKEKRSKESIDTLAESQESISGAFKEIEKADGLQLDKKTNLTNQLNNIITFSSWTMEKQDIPQDIKNKLNDLRAKSRELLGKL